MVSVTWLYNPLETPRRCSWRARTLIVSVRRSQLALFREIGISLVLAVCAVVTLPAQVATPGRAGFLVFVSTAHHDYISGRVVTGYDLGIKRKGARSMFRIRSVGLPAADPDRLVRIPLATLVDDLPSGEYEIAVRVMSQTTSSGWSSFIELKIER
jgi:hypothetical protein